MNGSNFNECLDLDSFSDNISRQEFLIRSASPLKSMIGICLPSILIMLVVSSYNIIDKFLAIYFAKSDVAEHFSNVISSDMTAENLINLSTSFAGNIVQLNFAITIMLSAGASVLFSINFGSSNKEGMSKVINNSFTASIIISLITGGLMFLMISPSTNYFLLNVQANTNALDSQTTQALDELSYQYASIACLMLPFSFIYNLFVYIYRSEGKMALVSWILVSSILTNIIFAVILIKYCHLMLMGAMLATGLSWVMMSIFCIAYSIFSKKTYFKFNWYYLTHIDFKNLRMTLALGLNAFINNLSTVILAVLLTILLGDLPIENNQLQILSGAMSPWSALFFAPASGILQGSSVLLAYAFGANRMKRYKNVMKYVVIIEIAWFLFGFIMILAFSKYMLLLFSDTNPDDRWLMVLNFWSSPFAGLSYPLMIYMKNIKRPFKSMLGSCFRSILIPVTLVVAAFLVTSKTGNPVDFFLFHGCSELAGFIALSILFGMEIRLYRSHHFNIDLDYPDDFTQFEVIHLEHKIKKWNNKNKKLNNSKDWFLKKYKIMKNNIYEKKIEVALSKINKLKLEKKEFVKRATNKQKTKNK